jgi:hypothetical protein
MPGPGPAIAPMSWGLTRRWFGLRGLRVEGQAGPGEEPVDEPGPVLDSVEPFLGDRGQLVNATDGEVDQLVSCSPRRQTVILLALQGVVHNPERCQ